MDLSVLSALIEKHEGGRAKPYRDGLGKLTIGVGRNLDDVGLSSSEIDLLLRNDILDKIAQMNREIPWWISLDDTRRMVLVDMAFNLGVSGLLAFKKMLNAVFAGDYRTAAAEMLSSTWAAQVGSRADELAGMMVKGSS